MAVQPHRISWTDERLDDLNRTVRDGFARNDREHEAFRQEMREMRTEFSARMDSLQRTLVIGMFSLYGGIVATIIGALITLN
jgi:hypothetical protein